MNIRIIYIIILVLLLSSSAISQNFSDSFKKESINDLPTQWKSVKGTTTIGELDGKKVLKLDRYSVFKPVINGEVDNYLGDQFTIEFDAYFTEVPTPTRQYYIIHLWDGTGIHGENDKHADPYMIYRHGIRALGSFSNSKKIEALAVLEKTWRHIKVDYAQNTLKIFIDDQLIHHQPDLFYKPTMVSLSARNANGENGITNFRLIGETEKNLDVDCGALPTEQQLLVLGDSTSLFNKRLKFIKNMSVDQLRGLRTLEYRNNEFVVPTSARNSILPTDNYTIIPIVAHILRQSDQKGGLTLNELYQSIKRANGLFDQYRYYIHLEKILFIDDDDLFNKNLIGGEDKDEDGKIDYKEDLNIVNRSVDGKLNIYFLPNAYVKTKNGLANTSWAYFLGKEKLNQHIVMYNEQAKNKVTLTHEIGHWFNLLHTHETRFNTESTNFQKCYFTGDLCCDTPLDPDLSGKVNAFCNYSNTNSSISSLTNPDPSNLMSYAPTSCRNKFSNDQMKRMYSAYLGMNQDRGYAFDINNQVGELIQTLSLSAGWSAIQEFESGSNTFMLFFNKETSEIAIYKLNNDGTTGQRIDHKEYRGAMSTAKIFRNGTTNYLVMISYSLGQLGIIKLNANGTLGAAQSYQIDTGCNNSMIAGFDETTSLALFNCSKKRYYVYEITSDGRLGKITHAASLGISFKYDIIEVIGDYIICYNPQSGYVVRNIMRDSGSFTHNSSSRYHGKEWTTIKNVPLFDSYGQSTNNLLCLNKISGQIKQYEWGRNESIDSEIEDNFIGENWYDSDKIKGNLPPGFDVVTPYKILNGNRYQNYVMFSNSTTGSTLAYHLNNR